MPQKPYKRIVDNKLKGAYGDIDFTKRVIRVNKSMARDKRGNIIATIIHEEIHAQHLRMHEKTVRKLEKQRVETMTPEAKKRLAAKYRSTK
jgi:hypothetical protein